MIRILICDDDPSYREILSYKIQKLFAESLCIENSVLCKDNLNDTLQSVQAGEADIVFLDVMLNEGVLENCEKMGEYFRRRAHEVIEKNHPHAVAEIRGLGLINGIQLTRESGQPVVDLCFKDSKVLINNTNGNVLRFIPPLIINEEEVDIVIKAVDDAMTKLGW